MAKLATALLALTFPYLVSAAEILKLPALDLAKLAQEDQISDKQVGRYRYGVVTELAAAQRIDSRKGEWKSGADGNLHWQADVFAQGATTTEVLLKPFRLSAGATLTVSDASGKVVWGPFDAQENNPARTLPLPIVAGERLSLQLSVPPQEKDQVELTIHSVTQGYRALSVVDGKVSAKAGGCNVDVVCPAGDPFREQARAVALLTIGGGLCTGSLMNTTAGDRAPIMLSARHCQITEANASAVTAYYTYQSATCRPASSGTISSPDFTGTPNQRGATLLASGARSDFIIMRLNGNVPAAADPYWLGWDRRDIAPGAVAVIHHPQGDEKRIAIENDPVRVTTQSQTITGPNPFTLAPGTALEIANWDVGTTEGGSSGSALFNRDTRRVIGTLSGGAAACSGTTNNGQPDYFGRLFTGWEGENTVQTRLKDHLDPTGSAALLIDGRGSCNAPIVQLSTSSTGSPNVREDLTFTASATGGTAPYTYAWDVDGDGVDDRIASDNRITTRYDRALSIDVRLRVTDALGCARVVTAPINVSAPDLRVESAVAGQQICGDNDNEFDPGERWRLGVNLRNFSLASVNGLAQFAPASSVAGLAEPDSFGYRYSDSATVCASSYIDISTLAPLTVSPAFNNAPATDEGRTAALIVGSGNFQYYGQSVTAVAMSTNGYLITNPETTMTGGDFEPNCGNTPARDPGKRMRVLHNDYEATALRTDSQSSCSRPSAIGASNQPCTIFDWSGMRLVGSSSPARFDMQAVVYPQSNQIVYQYRGDLSQADLSGSATGLMNNTTAAYNYSCSTQTPSVAAGKAVCFFAPGTQFNTGSNLILTKGAGDIGNLASGQSAVVRAEVQIPPSATCGQQLSLNYVAGVDERSVSPVPTRVNLSVANNCNVVNSCALPAQIALRGGSFYNPQRSGVGLVSFVIPRAAPQLPLFFGAWFAGDPDRRSSWYILSGDLIGNQVNAQILQSRQVTPAPNFTNVVSEMGQAQISLISPEKFLLTYQFTAGTNAGRVGGEIMQHLFTGLSAGPVDITGHYYNPSESGWGQTYESFVSNGVAQQFMLTYLYDAAGNPRWTLASFPDSQASGPASTYEVHCPSCAWIDFLPTGKLAGTHTRAFPNGFGGGTTTTQFTLQAPLSGTWNRTNAPIFPLSVRPQATTSATTTTEPKQEQ